MNDVQKEVKNNTAIARFHYLCILINKAISNKPWNISK